jgi:peptidoglycan/xylan/chitin deacetylase (PgdA/CDA1 family)
MRHAVLFLILPALLLASCAGHTLKEPSATGGAPLFSFVFDDGNDTDYLIARKIFLAHKAAMSVAVVTDWVNAKGRLTTDQIRRLQTEGFQILSHTESHPRLTSLTEETADSELAGSKAALNKLGIEPLGLVYPYNMSNGMVRRIARKYYKFARGGGSMLNTEATDRYALHSYSMKHDIDRLRGLIDMAYKEKKWLILYHHQIDVKVWMTESGGFIPGEDVRFSPSGAAGTYKRDIFIWSYFVPLSGAPREGDTVTGLSSGATGFIHSVVYNERQTLEDVLGYIQTRYPDMRIVTLEQGLKIMEESR